MDLKLSGFVLTHLSFGFLLCTLIYIVRIKNKKQLHYAFLVLVCTISIWALGAILLEYNYRIYNSTNIYLVYLAYLGLIFTPVAILLFGSVFVKTEVKLSYKHLALIVVPVLSLIMLLTNDRHHLFYLYVKYEDLTNSKSLGQYFIFHTIYSYGCILIGMVQMVRYSIKNAGFFSKQSIFILIGIFISFGYNFLLTIQIISVYFYTNVIAFFFTFLFFFVAIFRFNFLNIVPIALQKVVDYISDAYVVLDDSMHLIDYNKTFMNVFGDIINIKRNIGFNKMFSAIPDFEPGINEIILLMNKAKEEKKTISFEQSFKSNDFYKVFTIEITNIYSHISSIASLVLFKDITEHKKNIEALKEQQSILIEQERMASLGQLIGGIAHNIRTPIMSISGAIEALKDLAYEYRDSIDDKSVTEQDHKEIAKEMITWLDKMRPYCAYMSDVISAVKGQAVQMNASTMVKFTVDELVKRVELLMRHELKKNHIIMTMNSEIDMNTEIKGEVSNLIQVFDNIIINAVHAYEGKEGTIELKILRSGDNIEFVFKDNAKGIPKEITDRLFKEMVTTKGKNGTGLGLYMSYSTVRGRFGGNMSFSSMQGSGTTFYISIPCISYNHKEVS